MIQRDLFEELLSLGFNETQSYEILRWVDKLPINIYSGIENTKVEITKGVISVQQNEKTEKVEVRLTESMVRKIEIHIETTEDCLENFNLDKTTKELLVQDNDLFKEIVNYKK